MESDYYFLSYSRHDFYITESLSQQLKKKNIPYWFDVEQLQPGTDWETSIETGVKNAKGLILIVSQKSLRSSYVAKEWILAWLSKKPIYLVVIENISYEAIEHKFFADDDKHFKANILPEIAHSSIDFRANFQLASKKLIDVLTGRSKFIKDNIQSPNRFSIPLKSPLIIRLIIFTLFFLWLLTVITTFHTLIIYMPAFLLGLYFSYTSGRFIFKFLRREAHYQQLVWTLFVTPLFLLFLAPVDITLYFFILSMPLMTLFFMHIFPKSLLHWLPKGYAPAFLRYGIGLSIRRWRLQSPHYNGVKFKLYYHPADSHISNHVRSVLQKIGHQEITQEDTQIDAHIILISHFSDWIEYVSLTKSDVMVVCVLLGRINQHDLMKTFQTRQWVDYRTRNSRVLRRLAVSLLSDKDNKMVQESVVLTIPENFDTLVLPASIHWISFFLYLLGLSSFFLASSFLLAGVSADVDNAVIQLITIAILVGLPAYFSFSLIQTNVLIANREITFRQFLVFRLLPIGLIIFLLGVITANIVVLSSLLVFGGVAYFSLRHWLILAPVTTKPILSRFKSNQAYWKDNIVRFILVLLFVVTFTSGIKIFSTSVIDLNRPEEIIFQQIPLDENLTVSVPDQWYTAFVRSHLEQMIFNQETLESSIFSTLMARAHPSRKIASFYEIFTEYQQLNAMAKPLWITVYAPSGLNVDVFISVWSIEENYSRDHVAQQYIDNVDAPIMRQTDTYDLIEGSSSSQKINQFYITDDYVIIISAFERDLLGIDVILHPFLSAFGIESSV